MGTDTDSDDEGQGHPMGESSDKTDKMRDITQQLAGKQGPVPEDSSTIATGDAAGGTAEYGMSQNGGMDSGQSLDSMAAQQGHQPAQGRPWGQQPGEGSAGTGVGPVDEPATAPNVDRIVEDVDADPTVDPSDV